MARPALAIVLAAALQACGGDPDPMQPTLGPGRPASPDDPVVARVDGEPIHLSRVAELSAELDEDPRTVLDGMIEMTLLAGEAERRGLLEAPRVERVWKKALVQRLLEREVEAEVGEDSVTVDDVKAYYAANFENQGILLEQVWRDIWIKLVVDRRREAYEELVARVEERTVVSVDAENVARYLGQGVD
jgi:hypothetical protein